MSSTGINISFINIFTERHAETHRISTRTVTELAIIIIIVYLLSFSNGSFGSALIIPLTLLFDVMDVHCIDTRQPYIMNKTLKHSIMGKAFDLDQIELALET